MKAVAELLNEMRPLLERQAAWQKTRASLSWPEKIRQAEIMREAILNLRRTCPNRLKGNGTAFFGKRAL